MSKVSTLQKWGVVGRVAWKQASRSRTVRALDRGLRTTARSFTRAFHQLWLEVTGTMFLVMALFGGTAFVREYAKYSAHQAPASRLLLVICITLMFAWFGISSFWRVRRKSQR